MNRIARLGRHLVLDVSPVRRSRDLRCLVAGQLLSTLGGQLTTVAVPYQVYVLTRSSLDVGLVSLATVLPLIAGALLGGSLADAADRRKILLGAQSLTLACSAGLAVNADTGTALWPLFALPAMAAGFATATESGLSAILPNLVRRPEVAAVNTVFQALFQIGQIAGPAVAGLLLAGAGIRFVYWLDVATMAGAIVATFLMGPYAGVPLRRARGRRPARRGHRRLDPPDPAAGPRGDRRRHRVGRGDHLLRPGAVAGRRARAAGRGRLRRRHLGGAPRHDHPTRRARRAPRPDDGHADGRRRRRAADRGRGVGRGSGRVHPPPP